MKIRDNYKIRTVAGEKIVIPLGKAAITKQGIFKLNNSGAELFKLYMTEASIQDGIDLLMNKYALENERAKQDVIDFIEALKRLDMIEL